jgi:hypothetical protein
MKKKIEEIGKGKITIILSLIMLLGFKNIIILVEN